MENHDDSETHSVCDQPENGDLSPCLTRSVSCEEQGKISEHYTSIPYDIQLKATYEHAKSESDMMGVTYNGRMRQFVILDSKGVVTWKRQMVGNEVIRTLSYPKYEYKLITYLVYAKKYNCYFALSKDFSLKVMNHDFVETCSVSADMSSVLFLVFNPLRDELITGGVGGTKVWLFHQVTTKLFMEIKPLANFRLTLKYELPNVGGKWVKRVDLNTHLEHLYCCSDTDLFVYDMQGKLLLTYERAHTMSITGCCYSLAAKVLVTASIDSEVKVWSLSGGLVHTFRGHSRAVTSLIVHPENSAVVITSSLDGTVRMWSLEFMDLLYSLVVSVDGVLWMGLTDDQLLYVGTARTISQYSLNYFLHFWSMAHNQVTQLCLVGCETKPARVVATSSDSSVRLFARKSHKNMSTVLPPPNISPLEKILSVCYNREFNIVFLLVSATQIWIYTTRTDPACRIAIWDVREIQMMQILRQSRSDNTAARPSVSNLNQSGPAVHRAFENCSGNEVIAQCCCLCILNSTAMMWTDEGFACPIRHSFLLLGLEDGRILFLDPVVKGKKYMEFKASKDPILEIKHDVVHKSLITMCKLKELILIEIWSLPELELQHEIHSAPDISGYARHGGLFVTGHDSGNVIFHPLLEIQDSGLNKAKVLPQFSSVVDKEHRPEHNGPVVAIDVCPELGLFCSCSADGAIKIWESKTLLTEIMLDESLSAACFLTASCDLIVGFKQHIFYIDHSKVCPHLTSSETAADFSDQESYVYEDPSVTHDGYIDDREPVNMDSYLVPYEIEFSKDFIEGKLELNPLVQKEEEVSEEESEYMMAPTDIYVSPCDTPCQLSNIDLILDSRVTSLDLKKFMEENQDKFTSKKKKVKQAVKFSEDELSVEKTQSDYDMMSRFVFPTFGESPGPTPPDSRSASPEAPPTETTEKKEEVEEKKKIQPVLSTRSHSQEEWFKMIEDAGKVCSEKADKVEKPATEVLSLPAKGGGPRQSRLSSVRLNVKKMMKENKKMQKVVPEKDPELSVINFDGGMLEEKKKEIYYRDIKKKKFLSQRQYPKRGKKVVEEILTAVEESPADEDKQPELSAPSDESKAVREEIFIRTESAGVSEHVQTSERRVLDDVSTAVSERAVSTHSIPDLPALPEPARTKTIRLVVPPHDQPTPDSSTSKQTVTSPAEKDQQVQPTDKTVKPKPVVVVAPPPLPPAQPMPQPLAQFKSLSAGNAAFRLPLEPKPPVVIEPVEEAEPEEQQSSTDEKPVSIDIILPTAEEYQSSREERHFRRESFKYLDVRKSMEEFKLDFRVQVNKRTPEQPKQRPVSSFVSRRRIREPAKERKERPHTAAQSHFTKEDLQKAYIAGLKRYQSLAGMPLWTGILYKNDGTDFTDHWHERAIQRHMLIRMQKELRQYNATEKRLVLEQLHRERQQSLYGHSTCCQVPELYERQHLTTPNSSVLPKPPDLDFLQTAGPHFPRKRHPHTVNVTEKQTDLQPDSSVKLELSSERPFRLRMSPIPPVTRPKPDISPHLIDPRNPNAIRPKSSKSIPSKCSRYVLVSKPAQKELSPMLSPLEEQLMSERFPSLGMKLTKHYDVPVHHRSPHAISYSPFAQKIP